MLVYTGEVIENDFNNSRDEVELTLTNSGWNKLLVDATKGLSRASVIEDYKFVSDLRSRLPAGIRIALVLRPDQLGPSQFVEDVAQNRGLNLQLFEERSEALHWLLDS